jgi:hypothetical protein
MAQAEESASRPRSLLRHGDIDPGSKRLDLGLYHHNPVEAWRQLATDPSSISVAVHELAHIHSLTNIVGVVFTARAFFQQFFYEQLIAYAQTRRPGIEKIALVYLNTLFQRQRMLELWTPLLEGLAVYAQTSRPCRGIGELSESAASLATYGGALRLLDPLQNEPTLKAIPRTLDDAVAGSAELDVGGLPFAARLELGGAPEYLPYFLGHAYVRAVHYRFRKAMPELECPELFTNFLLRVLRGSARRTLLGRGVRPDWDEAVTRLYDWVDLANKASPRLLRQIYELPETADAIDALLCRDADDPLTEQWVRVNDAIHYVPDLLPGEWKIFVEMLEATDFDDGPMSTDELADSLGFERVPGETLQALATDAGFDGLASAIRASLPTYVTSTLMINITSGGTCRLLARVANGTGSSERCILNVDGHLWWLRLHEPAVGTIGFELGGLPTVDAEAVANRERMLASDGGLVLKIGSYHGGNQMG